VQEEADVHLHLACSHVQSSKKLFHMVVSNDETTLLRTWRLSAPDRDSHDGIGNLVCTTAKGHRKFGLGELSGVVLDVNID